MKKRYVLGLLCLGLLLSLFACAPSLKRMETQLVFWPERFDWRTPADYDVSYETLNLKAEDGTALEAWLIPGTTELWIIYFHGNANNISGSLTYPLHLQKQLGFNLIMAEYRGFYKSEGEPNEAGFYQDARAYYSYLMEQGVASTDIALYGFSLGSGVAVQLATEVGIAGLILQAPYTSVLDVARWRYNEHLPESLIETKFDNKSKIASINAPLFILHGTKDKSISFEHGQALFDLAREPKTFLAFEGGHSTLNGRHHVDFPNVTTELLGFIKKLE